MTIASLLALQVGFIFVFAERHHPVRPPKARPNFHLLTEPVTSRQLARTFFASDPTLFSGASLHSFSGPAWLRIDRQTYSFPNDEKLARWLDLDTNQLGHLSDLSLTRLRTVPAATELPSPKIEPFPFFRTEEHFRTQSTVRVVGDLAAKKPELPTNLPSWPVANPSELVTNSIVELAVCPGGEVVSSRLLVRSGSGAADAEAVRLARKLQFSGGAPSGPEAKLTWGRLVFEWRSLPIPETNGPPVRTPLTP